MCLPHTSVLSLLPTTSPPKILPPHPRTPPQPSSCRIPDPLYPTPFIPAIPAAAYSQLGPKGHIFS
ncbi:hypothetical protein E2C01_034366 [Portunus trituberculatus]|uniref:Uncharacterized protein n=1 Tax=Portunus trituberculatus TaxID=210409 RepID=A0A5B7F5J1_PORTR|nr:hypothetical protein [Portunus trituberculatus]